jgi:hypothetical protein
VDWQRQLVLFGVAMIDLNWRLKTANGLTWRMMRIEDAPRVVDLWREMDRKLGKQDSPNLFALPVLVTLVAEDELGEIVEALYGEAVIDLTLIGCDRRAMASTVELTGPLGSFLKSQWNIRAVRVLVPRRLRAGMKRLLPQFRDITERFAQFVFNL